MTPVYRVYRVAQFCVVLAAAQGIAAADRPAASDVWQIHIGEHLRMIPDSFAEFACGTNGGPPGTKLSGFAEFMRCSPEDDGLSEVYFRHDDELEYWAKANDIENLVASAGTKVYGLPVVMSVLIDADGIVRGLRLVSDPRDTSVPRADARFLQAFLMARFRPAEGDWACTDLPAAPEEKPVNGEFIKKDCKLQTNDMIFTLKTRYLRGKGERQIDPHTGLYTEDQFESTVRFEMREASFRPN